MKHLSFSLILLNLIIYAGEGPSPMLIYSFIVFFIGLIFFREFKSGTSAKLIRSTVSTFLLIVGMVMIFQLFKPLLTVEAALSLLLLLLVLKLYELENYQDYFHLFLITVLVQCGLLVLNPTFFSLIFALINIVLTFIFVIKINHYQLGSVNLKRLLLYLLPAIPLCFLLFFFFPRFTSGFMRFPDASYVSSGMNSEINFMNLGAMNLEAKTIFRANFTEPTQLGPAELYWRTTVLWDTDGMNWSEGHYAFKEKIKNDEKKLREDKIINYQLILEDSSQLLIPLLDLPLRIDVETVKFDAFQDKTFQFKHPMYSKKVVNAASVLLQRDQEFNPLMQKKSLRVKKNTYPQLEKLLVSLMKGVDQKNNKEKLQRLKDYYLTSGFTYSLKPAAYDSVEDFILNSKSGYCSHFASSFALLARLAGIPARIVNGYQGGMYNSLGNFYTVEARDAHAWVEVFDKLEGWIRVDPTELVFPMRIQSGARATLELLNPYLEFANFRINRKNFEFNWINQIGFFASMINNNFSTWFYEFDQDSQKFLAQRLGLKTKQLPFFLIFILIITLAIFYLCLKLFQKNTSEDHEVKSYKKFLKMMENRGLKKFPYEGPLHFKRRALKQFPEMEELIEKTIGQFIEKRYLG